MQLVIEAGLSRPWVKIPPRLKYPLTLKKSKMRFSTTVTPCKNFLLLIMVLTALALGGCSGNAAYMGKDFYPGERPEWVAVLPFDMEEGVDPDHGVEKTLRKSFYETFSYLGYLDRNLDAIDKKLEEMGLANPRTRDNHLAPEKLGELLKADYLIYGTIKKAVNSTDVLFAETLIRGHLKMIETRTGKEVWSKEHSSSVLSSIIVPDSAMGMIRDKAENANTQKAFRTIAAIFAKEITQTMEDPTAKLLKEERLPKIRNLDVLFKQGEDAEGPEIKVSMKGEPRMKAAFDIGSWKTNISMEEVRPGEYEGKYRVQKGEWVKDCMIVGKLTGEDGITGTRIYRERLVSFGLTLDQK